MITLARILVPTDFSDSAARALEYAASLAGRYQAEIQLLHVVEDLAVGYAGDLFPVPLTAVFEEIGGYARTELEKVAAGVREQALTVRSEVVMGKPAAEILRVAREGAADLIVLGTHGRGLLDHALFGSTTEKVVRQASCPVLTCRLAEPRS